jgi:hypothetical protein
MAVIIKHRRLVNPQHAKKKVRRPSAGSKKRSQSAKRNAPRKANPLITMGFVNPQGTKPMQNKKNKQQKKRAPRATNPAFQFQSKRKANNPWKPRKHRKHNPSFLAEPVSMAKTGAMALGGLVAARQLPQLILGAKNTGWIGYFANGITAALTAFVASKMAGKQAGQAVLIGGSLYLVNRVMTEQFSPAGNLLALSGVGDAAASSQMGAIRSAYYPVPVVYDRAGKPIIPQALIDGVKAGLPPAPVANSQAVAKLAGVGRLASRF